MVGDSSSILGGAMSVFYKDFPVIVSLRFIMKLSDCVEHTPVTVKDNNYGEFRVHKVLPAERNKARLVQVLHSSTGDFSFALIKTFKLSDLRKIQ